MSVAHEDLQSGLQFAIIIYLLCSLYHHSVLEVSKQHRANVSQHLEVNNTAKIAECGCLLHFLLAQNTDLYMT